MREQQIFFEELGQRIERALDCSERDRDAYAVDKVVSQPVEGVAQRVNLNAGALGRRRATAFSPQISSSNQRWVPVSEHVGHSVARTEPRKRLTLSPEDGEAELCGVMRQ